MYKSKVWVFLLLFLLTGCAGVSSMNRMQVFPDEDRIYRWALRDSDFKAAAKFVDSETHPGPIDYDQYKMIKVVECKTTNFEVSEDKMEIRQEVEIQYYQQNRPVVKTMQDNQVWRYNTEKNAWLLTSGLPKFEK